MFGLGNEHFPDSVDGDRILHGLIWWVSLGPLRSNSDNLDYYIFNRWSRTKPSLTFILLLDGGGIKTTVVFPPQTGGPSTPKTDIFGRKDLLDFRNFYVEKARQNLDLHRTIVFFSLQMVGPYIYQDLLLGMFGGKICKKKRQLTTPLSWSNGWF